MVQPHNRHMSFSLYIAALAVSDTFGILIGESKIYFKYYNSAIEDPMRNSAKNSDSPKDIYIIRAYIIRILFFFI